MAKRYHEERKESHMLSEDHGAPANMPQNVIMKEWPKDGNPMNMESDDTISGIDHQMSEDSRQLHKGIKPRKA